jgi:hypothetical protein
MQSGTNWPLIKTIKYRDVDYETAKKEVMGYFQERRETYASEIEEDLELDYKLICEIMDELNERDAWRCFDGVSRCSEIPFMATESEQRARKIWRCGVVRHERKRMRKKNP